MHKIRVSVIIPTLNEEKNIVGTLNSILSQVREVELNAGKKLPIDLEIIVIDSGSTDRTVDIVKEFQRRYNEIKLICLNFFHHSLTRNLGAKLSEGDIIVFLNADAEPVNCLWLSNLIKPVLHMTEASFSRQIPKEKALHLEYVRILATYPDKPAIIDRGNYVSFITKHGVLFSTVSCAVRRDVFFELGGFNPKVPINEDQEFAIKLLKKGFRITYAADSIVRHSHFLSKTKIARRYFNFGLGQGIIRKIHRDFPLKSGIGLLLRMPRILSQQLRLGAMNLRGNLFLKIIDLWLTLLIASTAFILSSRLAKFK